MNQTKKNGKWKRKMEPYAFLVPLVLILFLFLVIPLVKAAIMSFQYYYVTKPSPNGHYFVGLENYGKVLKDEYFFNSVKVTLIYIVVTVAGRYIIGFITALLLNTKFLGRGLARALIIIPWAVPEVVACLVWILMYDKDYGIINFLLNNYHTISHICRRCRLLFRRQWLSTYGKVFHMLRSCCWRACRVYPQICMKQQILTVQQHFRKSVTLQFRQSVRYRQQYFYCVLS